MSTARIFKDMYFYRTYFENTQKNLKCKNNCNNKFISRK